jgi:hypothetical protein
MLFCSRKTTTVAKARIRFRSTYAALKGRSSTVARRFGVFPQPARSLEAGKRKPEAVSFPSSSEE